MRDVKSIRVQYGRKAWAARTDRLRAALNRLADVCVRQAAYYRRRREEDMAVQEEANAEEFRGLDLQDLSELYRVYNQLQTYWNDPSLEDQEGEAPALYHGMQAVLLGFHSLFQSISHSLFTPAVMGWNNGTIPKLIEQKAPLPLIADALEEAGVVDPTILSMARHDYSFVRYLFTGEEE